MMKTVWMFSGQGSQYYQMGAELYRCHPRFRNLMDDFDTLVRLLVGSSLVDLLYNKKRKRSDSFSHCLHSNLALLAVETSLATLLLERGLKPDLLLGYSAGEIASHVIAGTIPLEGGIKVLAMLARLAEDKKIEGEMMAVIASTDILKKMPILTDECYLAAVNYDEHFILSGRSRVIRKGGALLKEAGITKAVLPVAHPFHSPLLDPIESEFKEALSGMMFATPVFSFCSPSEFTVSSDSVAAMFWNVIRSRVLFWEAVMSLEKEGPWHYIDLGPSGTLAQFVERIIPPTSRSRVQTILTPFGNGFKNLTQIVW